MTPTEFITRVRALYGLGFQEASELEVVVRFLTDATREGVLSFCDGAELVIWASKFWKACEATNIKPEQGQ